MENNYWAQIHNFQKAIVKCYILERLSCLLHGHLVAHGGVLPVADVPPVGVAVGDEVGVAVVDGLVDATGGLLRKGGGGARRLLFEVCFRVTQNHQNH